MSILSKRKVEPTLAQEIEDDIDEIDSKTKKGSKQKVESRECPDCAHSKLGPGLLDAFTRCARCKGTGKIAVLS